MMVEKERASQERTFGVEQLAEELGMGAEAVNSVIEALRKKGYLQPSSASRAARRVKESLSAIYDISRRFPGRHWKFGIVSDTHLGNKLVRVDCLEEAYDCFKKEGVRTVFHTGDLTDGYGVYEGQETEQEVIGQENQVQHAIGIYPSRKNIITFAISGNHDLKQYRKGGSDPVRDIANERKDLFYLGQNIARLRMSPGIFLELFHPNGKIALSVSIQSLKDLGNQRTDFNPDILICGHYHSIMSFVCLDHLYFLQAPCFKDYGILDEINRANPVIGYWTVEATITDDLARIQHLKPTPFTFSQQEKHFVIL